MSDLVRYAIGHSSLGGFIAAVSERGIVAFEFTPAGADPVGVLRENFADVTLVEDRPGLAPTLAALARLVDHPEEDPGLPLDLRGSDYERKIWNMLREIPAGATTSYGE